MRINGVVFDLDHTLYDRYATIKAMTPDFCRILGEYLNDDVGTDAVCSLLCDGDRRYIYFGWRRIFAFLCESGVFKTAPQYEQYRETMLKLYTLYAVPYPFTASVLAAIKARGLKTGLITNGNAAVQSSKLKLLHLEDGFDEVLLCGEFGTQKPDRAPFDEMARRLGLRPETLVYVGDNPVCDVEGARAAGYIPVEVLTAQCVLPDAVPARYRLRTVEELERMLSVIEND